MQFDMRLVENIPTIPHINIYLNHYCPVKREGASLTAMADAGFQAMKGGVDLKCKIGFRADSGGNVSESESMATMNIARISRNSCKVQLLGLRESSISLKQPIRHTPFVAVISVAQKTRVDKISQGATR